MVSSVAKQPHGFKILNVIEKIDKQPIVEKQDDALARWVSNYYFSSLGDAFSLFFSYSKKTSKPLLKKKSLVIDEQKDKQKISLTEEQQKASNDILAFWEKSKRKIALLKGPTGSGKSFVFLDLIFKTLEKKKSVLLLVPEISIVFQMEKLFSRFFQKQKINVFHSKTSALQKRNLINDIEEKPMLVIGTRSALFIAKWKNLGLVIVDEEHEDAYKNNTSPRYHVRQVVQVVAKQRDIPLLFASATPSVELMYHCSMSQIFLAQLTKRYNIEGEPKVHVIPVKLGRQTDAREDHTLDLQSFQAVFDVVAKGRQAIIYLNRRGFSGALSCKKCSSFPQCPNCDVALTYHKEKKMLLCHYCDYRQNFSSFLEFSKRACHSCGATEGYAYLRGGIEKVYEHMKKRFPNYSIARFDSDTLTTATKMEQLLKSFAKGEVDILIGTQMLAKGHDFKKAMLIVIVHPESILALPDYRSSERLFRSVVQAKGRVGRQIKEESKVLIETYSPNEQTLFWALRDEEEPFYQKEIEYRRRFLYPPFCKLFRFVVRDVDKKRCLQTATKIAQCISSGEIDSVEKQQENILILGPVPCFFSRLANYHRFQIIIKIKKMPYFVDFIKQMREKNPKLFHASSKSFVEFDMDPIDLF